MEDYKTLIEIVSELINRGYVMDFSLLENALNNFQKTNPYCISHEDFLIDEVHCCESDGGISTATYVFAISSKKYRFKGIVINALNEDDTAVWPTLFEKIKNRFTRVINSLIAEIIKKPQ